MMVENADGNMEFPRNVMLEDCFSDMNVPLYGFVTNVTLVEDSPCLIDVECFENGTSIKDTDAMQQTQNGTNPTGFDSRKFKLQDEQGTSITTIQNIHSNNFNI